MYFHLENWISDMASNKSSSQSRWNRGVSAAAPSTTKGSSFLRKKPKKPPTTKGSSQERSNFGSVANARAVDRANALAASIGGGGAPERDAAAALGRSNAPAVRLQGNPPPGMMASGLRQYQPQSMPDMGRPTPQGDPNDAYGWGDKKRGERADKINSEAPNFFAGSRDNVQNDYQKWMTSGPGGGPPPGEYWNPNSGGPLPTPGRAQSQSQSQSQAQSAPAIGQNPMFSRGQVNAPQIKPFGGSGGPSWLEKARSSSGMGGGGGMRPQQPQQPQPPVQQPAPGMAAGGMQQPRPQPQMRPNPSQTMGGGGGSALQQALRGGA
jgi:hypothetical protein